MKYTVSVCVNIVDGKEVCVAHECCLAYIVLSILYAQKDGMGEDVHNPMVCHFQKHEKPRDRVIID